MIRVVAFPVTLTRRCEYALRTLIRLGLAHSLGRSVLSASDLAEVERLPLKFIEQILFQLRGEGYIETRRGKFGGYRIAKPLNEISMGTIVRLFDGSLAPIKCASESDYERCTCPDEDHCGLRMLMIDLRNAMADILDRYTLDDIIEVTLRKIRRDGLSDPFCCISPQDPPKRGRHADPRDGLLALLSAGVRRSAQKN
jgi:Rrf2 family protein